MDANALELAKKAAEDPTKAWAIAKAVGELITKAVNFRKRLKSSEEKREVDEILDALRDLKHSASELEDQNRELREKLRFKNDDYEFRSPFRYRKDRPEQPLCARCFANQTEGPMGEQGRGCPESCRKCLVCGKETQVKDSNPSPSSLLKGYTPFPGRRFRDNRRS
jgi:hypothetical protein